MVAAKNTKVLEARAREFMTDTERRLKKKLIALLRDDGKGHRHAKYAERLEKFDIQIVPLKVDPEHTASINFDRGIITISEGFLNDPATFYQLNVLMRHELAHNLLMHQIRMMYLLGEEAHAHMSLSQSLHLLHNLIADGEISNRKYSEEDKIIIRNLVLNGNVIKGIVTEDHRKDWIKMSIEEMYNQLCLEIAEIQKQLQDGKSLVSIAKEKRTDHISRSILNAYIYSDTISDSIFPGSLETFIDNGCRIGGKRVAREFISIITNIYSELNDKKLTDEDIKTLMSKIASSSPVEVIDLFDNKQVVLYTPEEKYIAVETIKKFRSDYTKWHGKVLASLDELSDDELRELLDLLK